jgi:hypothetical protein
MEIHRLLLLDLPDYSDRLGALLTRMESEESLRQMYLRDPSTILSKALFPDQPNLPRSVVSRSNRLLFSLLSNQGFMTWADTYGAAIGERARNEFPNLSEEEAGLALAAKLEATDVYDEVINAVVANSDRELLASLLTVKNHELDQLLAGRPSMGGGAPGISVVAVFVVVFVAVFVVIAATELNHHFGKTAPTGFARTDLDRLSRLMIDGLTQEAESLRAAGTLGSANPNEPGVGR